MTSPSTILEVVGPLLRRGSNYDEFKNDKKSKNNHITVIGMLFFCISLSNCTPGHPPRTSDSN